MQSSDESLLSRMLPISRLRRQRKVCDQPIDDRRDCLLPRTGPGEPLDDLLDLEGRCARERCCQQLAGILVLRMARGYAQRLPCFRRS